MQMTGLNLGENFSSQYFVYLLDGAHASDTFAHSPLLSKAVTLQTQKVEEIFIWHNPIG